MSQQKPWIPWFTIFAGIVALFLMSRRAPVPDFKPPEVRPKEVQPKAEEPKDKDIYIMTKEGQQAVIPEDEVQNWHERMGPGWKATKYSP